MSKISEAPISENVIDDAKKARPAWVEFFANLTRGDVGTTWSPSITGLTTVGTPVISGVYYQNTGFTDFAIKIVPSTNTSSTLGATYVTLPFLVTADVPCFAVYSSTIVAGIINAASGIVYFPTWALVTTPVTITGRVKN